MDFQLILYIIIVIVWLVLDNYRRIKKKQEYRQQQGSSAEPQSETYDKPYTSLEDILREFGMEEAEPEVVVEKPKPVKKQVKPVPALQKYDTYESNINKDYKFSSETFKQEFKPVATAVDEIKRTEIKDIKKERKSELKDFDLRKAVIWSEILKRPYA